MTLPDGTMNRRALLRNGALTLSAGALIAACGSERGGSDAPGRLGIAAPAPTLPPGDVDDSVLLRTAQSIEYTAIAVYEAALALDVLTADETAIVERFIEDHTGHADLMGSLASDAGGEPYECPNPFVLGRAVRPILDALEGSDDVHRDVLNTAYAFEEYAGRSYQALVPELVDMALRSEVLRVGGDENRHAAALAAYLNPEELFNPELIGESATDDEFGVPYAIPAVFGQLSGVVLVVGAPDQEGSRTEIQLQTPAANSLIYADTPSC